MTCRPSSFAIDVPDALLARMRQCEPAAFEQIYRWFERPVFTLALRICGEREQAADVLQDATLKVIDRIGELRGGNVQQGGSPFWGWLCQIAVNEALMTLRRRRRPGEDGDYLDDIDVIDELPPPAAADAAQLQHALEALPVNTRTVLWLYHAEGCTHVAGVCPAPGAAVARRVADFANALCPCAAGVGGRDRAHLPGLGAELEALRSFVDPVLAPVLGDVAAAGIDKDVLQHHARGRVLDHDHHFVRTAALRRCARVVHLQQHGFVEGEIDGIFALHRQD